LYACDLSGNVVNNGTTPTFQKYRLQRTKSTLLCGKATWSAKSESQSVRQIKAVERNTNHKSQIGKPNIQKKKVDVAHLYEQSLPKNELGSDSYYFPQEQ
jgi:hypothetical protein